jgi:hypothetical protein
MDELQPEDFADDSEQQVEPDLRSAVQQVEQAMENLLENRDEDAEVQQEVQDQSGSGKLARLALRMARELSRRRSLLGKFISPFFLGPPSIAIILLAVIATFLILIGGSHYGMMVIVGTALYAFLVRLIGRRVDMHAEQRMRRFAELCHSRGLLRDLAMGILPMDELHSSVPVIARHLLYSPGLPTVRKHSSADYCWILMWNADFFCGEKPKYVRERWHVYWLLPLLTLCLPASAVLFGFFTYAMTDPVVNHEASTKLCFLASLLFIGLTHLVYVRILDTAARHMAGAWGIVLCMAELVLAGEEEESDQ